MDSLRRELFNGGLRIVVTLLVRRQINVVCASRWYGNPAVSAPYTAHWRDDSVLLFYSSKQWWVAQIQPLDWSWTFTALVVTPTVTAITVAGWRCTRQLQLHIDKKIYSRVVSMRPAQDLDLLLRIDRDTAWLDLVFHVFSSSISGLDVLCGHTKKTVWRETERATADLNVRMKSSRRGASNGGVQKFIFSFFWDVFLKNRGNMP